MEIAGHTSTRSHLASRTSSGWYLVRNTERSDARMTIIRTLMMVAIAGVVVLAIVAEARLTPELRQELFEATDAHP